MTSSPISNLCQELIDEIIDSIVVGTRADLSTGQRRNFTSCALVCRAFLPRAQRHLFSYIIISGRWNRQWKCQYLSNILQRRPRIASYIKELHLTLWDGFEPSWVTEDHNFTKIMHLITDSKGSFTKLTWEGDFIRTQPSLIDSFSKFFQSFISPFITSLTLGRVVDFPDSRMVTSCSNLIELTLIDSRVHLTLNGIQPNPLPELRKLTYIRFPPGWSILKDCPIPILPNLKSITLNAENWEPMFDKLTEACSDSLEELNVDAFHSLQYIDFDGYINLQNSPHLRILDSHVRFRVGMTDELAAVSDSLSTLSSTGLESMNLIIYLGFELHGRIPQPEALLDVDWDILCSKLTGIISGRLFQFSVSLRYMVGDWRRLPTQESSEEVHDSCQRVLETLYRQKLSSLTHTPNVAVTLDHLLYRGDIRYCIDPLPDDRGFLRWFSSEKGNLPERSRLPREFPNT